MRRDEAIRILKEHEAELRERGVVHVSLSASLQGMRQARNQTLTSWRNLLRTSVCLQWVASRLSWKRCLVVRSISPFLLG